MKSHYKIVMSIHTNQFKISFDFLGWACVAIKQHSSHTAIRQGTWPHFQIFLSELLRKAQQNNLRAEYTVDY